MERYVVGSIRSDRTIVQPTVGNQTFQIPDQAAAGTYNLCIENSTPGTYTFTVPSGVYSLSVDMAGASGGPSLQSNAGGGGARVQAILKVTPGESLTYYVGGKGWC